MSPDFFFLFFVNLRTMIDLIKAILIVNIFIQNYLDFKTLYMSSYSQRSIVKFSLIVIDNLIKNEYECLADPQCLQNGNFIL